MPLPQTRQMLAKLHELREPATASKKRESLGFAEKAIALVLCVASLGLYTSAVLFVVGFPTSQYLFIAAIYFGDVTLVFGVLWLIVVTVRSFLLAWPAVRNFTSIQADIIDRDEAGGLVFRRFLGCVSTDEVEERIARIKHHMSDVKSRGVFIAAIGIAITSATASKLLQGVAVNLKSFDLSFIGIGLVASAAVGGLFFRYAELRFGPLVFELERALTSLGAAAKQTADIVARDDGTSRQIYRTSLHQQQLDAREAGRSPLAQASTIGLAAAAGWLLGALLHRR